VKTKPRQEREKQSLREDLLNKIGLASMATTSSNLRISSRTNLTIMHGR